ncbi:DivIVA domain-containing protein [Sanguibacter gelidistatuariae]|uniref:Cell wall synthesis protein Wag31 n=1 Tax=Sanguibacter gelidistatuariae TaxID=1814289 RepID=A0A1G6P0F1_9MICO|nr:DivIVA domain-containing protein [Sanguibacter gelidistatuariae]
MVALLTADDVLTKKFPATKFREGYDVVEVDDFLDEVLNTLRELYAENDDLKAKLEASERRVAELSRANAQQSAPDAAAVSIEKVVEEPKPEPVVAPVPVAAPVATLAPREPEMATGIIQMAQKLHDDHVRAGQDEGDRLISEAKSEGSRIVREAEETSQRTLTQLEQERSLLERKIDELRIFERDYRTRLKSYLQNLLGDLDNRASALPSGVDQAKQGI